MELEGRKIGNYVVEKKLGEGGMGRVYRCRHPLIGHVLAMKVLHEENARDPELVQRFVQEAQAAAEIGHPNVIDVVDFGTFEDDDGQPQVYLMMELLQGESLTKRAKRTGLTLAQVSHIMLQCCDALQASHDHGIVHRDLKPENIYVCERESSPLYVKIMDFGIAKLLYPDRESARTRLGVVLGTPYYMSPEQCQGKGRAEIDERSDVYSLGVVLYELLVGRVPFHGTIGEVLNAHLHVKPTTPSALVPSIPPDIDAIVLRAMEKHPLDRFQSMKDFANALHNPHAHQVYYEHMLEDRGRKLGTHSGNTLRLEVS